MKKFKLLCFFVAFVLIASVTALAVGATAAKLTVSAEAVSTYQGETVEVALTISNNPGIGYLSLTLNYNTDVLTLTEVVNGGMFKDVDNDLNLIFSADDNVFGDGTLATLVFTVNDDASLDTYPIEILFRECYKVNATMDAVEGDVVDGSVTVTEYIAVSTIDSADLVLSDSITINYYATLDPAHEGAKMRFTMHDAAVIVEGKATDTENVYVYAFDGVSPQHMGDSIKAELLVNDSVVSVCDGYSVKQYCTNMLKKIEDKALPGYSDKQYAALSVLLADLLEYGAASQVYCGYKTDALVNKGIIGATAFAELDAADAEMYLEETALEGVQFTAAGIRFDFMNRLYFKFTAPDMTEDGFGIRVTNYETEEEIIYTLSQCTLLDEETALYVLYTAPLMASGYGDWYSIELCTVNNRGRWVSQQLLEYSVASYVYSMQKRTDTNGTLSSMAMLARATYNYGLSAKAYANLLQ